MNSHVGRTAAVVLSTAVAAFGVLLVVSAWNAWDPLPPDGPSLFDVDRFYEGGLALIGLLLVVISGWIAARSATGLFRRT
jgi:hypothetical protein